MTSIRNENGELHCLEKDPYTPHLTLPAFIAPNGDKMWYKDGIQHRDDKDPHAPHLTLPAVICSNGDMEWWQNGQLHRTDVDLVTGKILPAIIRYEGNYKAWYINDKKYA